MLEREHFKNSDLESEPIVGALYISLHGMFVFVLTIVGQFDGEWKSVGI
jgi:hypothetical protein